MDQTSVVLIISLILAFVAVIVLAIALFGFWRSLKETNRKCREGPASEYRSVPPPDITARLKKTPKIEFGEIIDAEAVFSQESFVTVQNSTLGICTVCHKRFSNINHVVCPRCGAEYHDHCFSEFESICVSCGWRQQ